MRTLRMGGARGRWIVLAILWLDAAFLLGRTALEQLRVVVVAHDAPTVRIDDGLRRPMGRSPVPADVEVRILNDSPPTGPRRVDMPGLRTVKRALLFDAQTYRSSGDFAVVGSLQQGGVWRSDTPGSSLSWTGRVSGLAVTFLCSPDSGRACVEGTGLERWCHDLSTCTGAVQVAVPSPRTAQYALVPWWRHRFRLFSARPVRVDELVVSLGNHELYRRTDFRLAEPLRIDLPFMGRLTALAWLAANGVALIAQCLGIVVVMVLLGGTVVVPIADRLRPLELVLLAFFAGEGLSANFMSAVALVVSATRAWYLVLGVGVAILFLQLWRGGIGKVGTCLRSIDGDERSALPWLLGIAATSALVVAFPVLPFPGWFVGQGYTDSVDYATWASLANTAPINHHLGAIRFQDFVRVAFTSLTLGIDTRSALAPQGLVLWMMLPCVAWAFLRRFGARSEACLLGAALVAHGLCLFEIFTQCFLPHYEVTQFTIAAMWAIAWFVDDGRLKAGGRSRWWAEAALACVFAAGVGLFPYQAFAVMAFAVVSLVVAVRWRAPADVWSLARVGLLTALVCNANLWVVLDFSGGAMQHRQSLNDIARGVSFPWYASPEAPAILTGTEDFVRSSLMKGRLFEELFAAMPAAGRRFARAEAAFAATTRPFAFVVLGCAVGSLAWLLRRRDRAALVAVTTLLLPLVMAVELWRSDDVYFWVKSLMTLGGLALIPVAGLVGALVTSERRWCRVPGILIAVWFVLVGLRTAFFDTVTYAVNRESQVVEDSRTHLAVHDRGMHEFQTWVKTLPAGRRFVLLGTLYDRYFTDGDYVTYNRALQLLERHTVRFGFDEAVRTTRSRDPGYRGSQPLTAFTHALEFGSCGELPVPSRLVMETNLFCVRAIADGAPG